MKQIRSNALPGAWICNSQDRGRKAIKNGKIYLNPDQEFVIELFNPLQKSVLTDIKIDGKSVSSTGLIICPGQRAYLECFVDDKRKFIFKTYQIDGSDKEAIDAIRNNGNIEISFYEEEIVNYWPYWWGGTTTTTITTSPNWYYTNGGNFNLTSGTSNNFYCSSNLTNCSYTDNIGDLSNSVETGRVEKGGKSNQNFEEVYKNFNNYIVNKIEYKLLPTSQQPKEVEVKKPQVNNWKDVLVQLKDLHDIGVLTIDEYEKKKNEILSRI